jgi:predicted transposase YbfD/YdcC
MTYMEQTNKITEYFAEAETSQEHNGYFCSVGEALTIVILGTLCGLRNASQIHQWAANGRVSEFLAKHFNIEAVPCYYWLLCLLKIVKPKSLNKCFMNWVQSFLPDGVKGLTLSFDGKAIRSTGKMSKHKKSLHIVSAHIAELGITFGQETVDDKSNEIPAVRNLIEMLNIEGCMVVADALHCQKDTAKAVIEAKADYLLSVKGNQETLEKDIEDYVQTDGLRKTMDTFKTFEKNRERIEKRTAFSTCDVDWLYGREEWAGLCCIGAIHTQFTTTKTTTDEWHYYISSRKLTAEQLLKHARLEWSVEVMHWLLDVHFGEDFCRVEDSDVQQNLNIVRKIALNSVNHYKEKTESKRAVSKIMLDCLLESAFMLEILCVEQN